MFDSEVRYLRESLGRSPTPTEAAIISAEWSEHCSYKSSKELIRTIPRRAPHTISASMDSGAIDVGDGYVVTAHIESHNHPSALEPYGGAATGVGGILRDIMSAGTRPVAVLDGLRFGDISRDSHAAWLLGGAVRGISDYGNCMGIPTIGGEAGFDACYTGYAIVDVAAVGFGKRERLIRNRADPGDHVVLMGGPTGYDGVGGSQFASKRMDAEGRSAVQIPDPFMEKMVMEAVLELRPHIKALKDLGGGGLACALSETADSLGVGIAAHADCVRTREDGMEPPEVMISESQERMLVITDDAGLCHVARVCSKFGVPFSVIGGVDGTGNLNVYHMGKVVASLPAKLAANAPPIRWPARPMPTPESGEPTPACVDIPDTIYRMLENPDCADRSCIYSQYDHEVGIRTVRRPGLDASSLRLDNGKYLSVSMSGNPRHCAYNPYRGAMGCFEESCRNVACAGARPVAMLDHLQFGSPENPETFWAFQESVRALAEYAGRSKIPCIGGKVSLYNETDAGPIKPTPVIMVLGLSDDRCRPPPPSVGDILVLVGKTGDECGGSTYQHVAGYSGGACPQVDVKASLANMKAARNLAGAGMLVHDCSRGGLAAAAARLCMLAMTGCSINLRKAAPDLPATPALFSESHSRYLAVVPADRLNDAARLLSGTGAPYSIIGEFAGDTIRYMDGPDTHEIATDRAHRVWSGSLERMILNG